MLTELSFQAKMSRKNAPLPTTDAKMDDTPPPPTDGFAQMQLKPKDFCCDSYEVEMMTRKGAILQYVNQNSLGATTMIGATRIGVQDPRKIPLYIHRYKTIIRQHAVATLQQHMLDTQCSTGVLENLTVEDYSISFSWASVSDEARKLNLGMKSELPLSYAGYENWIVPVYPCKDGQGVYVVNVHIMLQEPTKRKNAVLKRSREDELAKIEAAKKPRIYQGKHYQGMPTKEFITDAAVAAVECYKRSAPSSNSPPPQEAHYPPLPVPVGSPPEWNRSGKMQLPTD
jgi:hypothetical protein